MNVGDGDKTIGVIGGMGPEATVDFMQRVIALTPAADDKDHLRMLVDNNPKVPSRIARLLDRGGADPGPVLCDMAAGLEVSGVDFLVMPCNTAHHYYDAIEASVEIPLLNMPELAINCVRSQLPAGAGVGLLASSVLGQICLYEPYLEAAGLVLLYPERAQQDALMDLIRAVKAGKHTPEHLSALDAAAQSLQAQGARALLIACTELSINARALEVQLPIVDASQVLAEAAVDRAKT